MPMSRLYLEGITRAVEQAGRLAVPVNNFGPTDVGRDPDAPRRVPEDFIRLANRDLLITCSAIYAALSTLVKEGARSLV